MEFFTYYPQAHFLPVLHDAGIKTHHSPKKGRLGLSVLLTLRKLIDRGNYDVVLSYLDTPNFYSEMASIGLRQPVIVASERSATPPGRPTLRRLALMHSHRMADWITVNSYHQRERMERQYPWLAGKLQTIYNGVDLSIFSPADKGGISSQRQLLAVGTIVPSKNPIGLIRALGHYRDRFGEPPIIRWVGKQLPTPEGAATFQEANALISELRLEPYWEWLGERRDVPHLIQQHDGVIHASFFEGLPNAICEGLASGRPVLASAVCDHPRLVMPGSTGYLFDPHDPADIASAIRKLCVMQEEELTKMGRAARKFSEVHLAVDRLIDDYEALFDHLGSKRKLHP